jgi:hypothetical protein
MKMRVTKMLIMGLSFFLAVNMHGMSKQAHLNGVKKLGGMFDVLHNQAGELYIKASRSSAEALDDWMDAPARNTGKYRNIKAGGGKLTPSNHNALRHNPKNVSKALSGTGKISPYKYDMARVHKIQDIYNNKAMVDGWELNSKRKREAEKLLKYLDKHKKLPKKLPVWVDSEGPWIHKNTLSNAEKSKVWQSIEKFEKSGGKLKKINGIEITEEMAKKLESVRRYTKRYGKLPKSMRIPKFFYDRIRRTSVAAENLFTKLASNKSINKILAVGEKFAIPILIAAEGGMLLYKSGKVEEMYKNGVIDDSQRIEMHSTNIGRSIFVIAGGAAVILLPFDAPILVTIAGGIVVVYVAEKVGEYIGSKVGEYLAAVNEEEKHQCRISEELYCETLGDYSIPPELLKDTGMSVIELNAYKKAYKRYYTLPSKKMTLNLIKKEDFMGLSAIDLYLSKN